MKPARLLVLDDSPTACVVLARLLAREWWTVETYQRPLPALQALWHEAESPPTALILDIGLPQLDGYQVAQLIRKKAPTAELRMLPIIGLSARDGRLDRIKASLVGINVFLTKPFDPRELLDLVWLLRGKPPPGLLRSKEVRMMPFRIRGPPDALSHCARLFPLIFLLGKDASSAADRSCRRLQAHLLCA